MFVLHGFDIERALGFVEHEDVLRRDESGLRGVSPDIVLHAAHKRLAVTAGAAQLVLEDLDDRAIAAEEHGRRGGLPRCTRNRQVVYDTSRWTV